MRLKYTDSLELQNYFQKIFLKSLKVENLNIYRNIEKAKDICLVEIHISESSEQSYSQ